MTSESIDWEFETYLGYLTQNILSTYEVKEMFYKQRKINADLKIALRKIQQKIHLKKQLEIKVQDYQNYNKKLQQHYVLILDDSKQELVPVVKYEIALYKTMIQFVEKKIIDLNNYFSRNSHMLNYTEIVKENDYFNYIIQQSLRSDLSYQRNRTQLERFISLNQSFNPIIPNIVPSNLKILNFLKTNTLFFDQFIKQFALIKQLTLYNETFMKAFNIGEFITAPIKNIGLHFLNRWNVAFEIKIKSYLDNILNQTGIDEANLCMFAIYCWEGEICFSGIQKILTLQNCQFII